MTHVERTIELDAPADEVWQVLTDDDRLAEWLDDGGAHRRGGIEENVPGERLTFRWYEGTTGSRVTFTLEELDDTHTRLTVTETLLRAGRARAMASASVSA